MRYATVLEARHAHHFNGMQCNKWDSGQQTSGQVSFLTYNVHGLPSEITGDDTSADDTMRLCSTASMWSVFKKTLGSKPQHLGDKQYTH